MDDGGLAQGMARQSVRRRKSDAPHPSAGPLCLDSVSPVMARVLVHAREVAATDATVLLTGETGTGKEVIARHIHALSERASEVFIAVNCGALPAQLIESELFGHERGAFSGANERRIGHFECAQGGTLLLDEVSEIPLPLQTRLLRVLQEREVQRIGSSRSVPLDVRIIATTNRDLRSMVARGELRKDLFYRLNVFPLALPPLRERKEDIPALARSIISRLRRSAWLSDDALEALRAHDFPGNVRELANLIERALVTCPDGAIGAELLRIEASAPALASAPAALPESNVAGPLRRSGMSLDEIERQLILDALVACNGNRTHASLRLGISVRTMRNKLRTMRDLGWAVPEPSPYGLALQSEDGS